MSKNTYSLESFFPFWNKLSKSHQNLLRENTENLIFKKGSEVLNSDTECLGLIFVRSGILRAHIVSDSGREVTLYRLLQGDICLLSASCIMSNIQFKIHLEAEEDSHTYILNTSAYEKLITESILFSNYINEIISSRFSEVVWTLEQILFKSMDSRIADFLVEQSILQESDILSLTHNQIAKNLGTAREVISRILKYFQNENILTVTRGKIKILDKKSLIALSR
ncbi:Crp/Fnr family transcriptional regulator [Anaerosphaera multitolerans]|uniref:Crp/Fnr family transcriptional regulator n=1 Tax=Anaerosphaera multitolerans TaxID=2487351 RepID=A0A437S4K3_9FIRM|nr:Crp/Fnr family transcriptional regulator [Anaerosphaera multitolerans]RVU53886.1 Crp/Fnr family transcriptional regulator [Anaerosphaera multitolerans]